MPTGWQSLKRWQTLILESHANVVCFYHNGGVDLDRAMHDIVAPLAAEDRISIVVLGEHVREVTQRRTWHWGETEGWAPWERVPVEIFHPVRLAPETMRDAGLISLGVRLPPCARQARSRHVALARGGAGELGQVSSGLRDPVQGPGDRDCRQVLAMCDLA